MSLDFESPHVSQVQAKRNELSHVFRSRKRKLCELYAIATAGATSVPEYCDAQSAAPSNAGLARFLELNDLEKGRYFSDSSLPIRRPYASNVTRTRQSGFSTSIASSYPSSNTFSTSRTGQESKKGVQSSPPPKKAAPIVAQDVTSTAQGSDDASPPPPPPAVNREQASKDSTDEKHPMARAASGAAQTSVALSRDASLQPERPRLEIQGQKAPDRQDAADPSVSLPPALRSIRTSRPESPPYSPGTDPNATGAPPSVDDPNYKDSNASSTVLTPHRDEDRSAASQPGSGRSSPNSSSIAHMTVEDSKKLQIQATRRRAGSSVDNTTSTPAAQSISDPQATRRVLEGIIAAEDLIKEDKINRPPMASFGKASSEKTRLEASNERGPASKRCNSDGSLALATTDQQDKAEPMAIDGVPPIVPSSALQARREHNPRITTTKPEGHSQIVSATLNKTKNAKYSGIVKQLRKNRVPESKRVVKKRDYMQLLIMRQVFNSPTAYGRDLGQMLGDSNKTLTSADWQAKYREEEDNRILQRIYHLQDTNRWSLRLPKPSVEVAAPKVQWDTLLEDVKWLRTDFREERKTKMVLARDLAEWCAEWVESTPEERISLQVPIRKSRASRRQSSESIEAEQAESGDSVFAMPMGQVYFHGCLSSLDKQILEQLPFYGPSGSSKEQVMDFTDAETVKVKIEEPTDMPKQPQSTDPMKTAVEEMMKDVEEASGDERIDDDLMSIDNELPPEEDSCALFDPANKHMRTRLNTVWPFRPPAGPVPPQSFYEHRHPSQWTYEDDQQLRTYVKNFPSNWSLISDQMSADSQFVSFSERRTPWECFERLLSLEGPPANAQQHQYLRHFHYRIERARATFNEHQEALQRQAQQQALNAGQPPPPNQPKRFPSPMRVERKPNKRFLAMLDASRKLARKREAQLTKMQNTQSHSEAQQQAQQNRGPQVMGARNIQPPSYFSQIKYERERKEHLRMMELREHQKQAIEAQKRSQQAAAAAAAGGFADGNNSNNNNNNNSSNMSQQQQSLSAHGISHNSSHQQQARAVNTAGAGSANGPQPSQVPSVASQIGHSHLAIPQMVPNGNRRGSDHAHSAAAVQMAMQNAAGAQINGNSSTAAAAIAAAMNGIPNGTRVLQANMGGGAANNVQHQRFPSGSAAAAAIGATSNGQMSSENMQRLVHAHQLRVMQQQYQQQQQQHQQGQQHQQSQQHQQGQQAHQLQQFGNAADSNSATSATHGSPNMSSSNGYSSSAAAAGAILPNGVMLSPGLPQAASPSQAVNNGRPSSQNASSSSPPSLSAQQVPQMINPSSQQQASHTQAPQQRPRVLSSGHVPHVMHLKHQIKQQNPQISDAEAQLLATERLKNSMILQQQQQAQSRQNAMNAASGLYNSTPQQHQQQQTQQQQQQQQSMTEVQRRNYNSQMRAAHLVQAQQRASGSSALAGAGQQGSPKLPSAGMSPGMSPGLSPGMSPSMSPTMAGMNLAAAHNQNNRTPTPSSGLPAGVMRPPSRHSVPVAVPQADLHTNSHLLHNHRRSSSNGSGARPTSSMSNSHGSNSHGSNSHGSNNHGSNSHSSNSKSASMPTSGSSVSVSIGVGSGGGSGGGGGGGVNGSANTMSALALPTGMSTATSSGNSNGGGATPTAANNITSASNSGAGAGGTSTVEGTSNGT